MVLRRLLDGVVIVVSLVISTWLFDIPLTQQYWLAIAWAVLFFFFSAEISNLYESRRLSSLGEEAFQIFLAWVAVMLGLILLEFLTKTSANFSRLVIGTWFLLALAALVLFRVTVRIVLHKLRKRGRNVRTLVIAGAGKLAQQIAAKVLESGWTGLSLTGFYADDRPAGYRPLESETFQVRGNLDDMVAAARAGKMDFIYVALPMQEESRVIQVLNELSDTTASVYLVPDFFVFDMLHAHWVSVDGVPMVSIFETPFYGVSGWLKRIEDIVVASIVLAAILIPALIIALGIKLTSPGPAIFKQRRYGLNGRVVEVWKFRTMTVCEDGENVPQAKRYDSRVTRFGAFLRRLSLDELPQFINVLQGHMSVVGPRPHPLAINEEYRRLIQGYMLRHKVKPGITGWAQVNGWRGETETLEKMQKRVELDLEYVQNWSLWLDIKILLLTLSTGFIHRNAY